MFNQKKQPGNSSLALFVVFRIEFQTIDFTIPIFLISDQAMNALGDF